VDSAYGQRARAVQRARAAQRGWSERGWRVAAARPRASARRQPNGMLGERGMGSARRGRAGDLGGRGTRAGEDEDERHASGTRAAGAATVCARRPSVCSDPYGQTQACARDGERAPSAPRRGDDIVRVASGEKDGRVRDLSAGRSMHSRRGPSRALLE
jgi:hypothetical protein